MQAQLLERGLELRAELAPLDPLERAERRLDRGPLAAAREVRAEPRAEVSRLADVEHGVVPVAEEVDARACAALRRRAPASSAAGARAARRARAPPRACARLAPARAREARSRISAVASASGSARWHGEVAVPKKCASAASEKRSLRRWRSLRASQTVSSTGAATRRPERRSTSPSRKRDVEARVVRRERGVAREREEAADGHLRPRGAAQVGAPGCRSAARWRAAARCPGSTSVSNVSAISSARTRTAPISHRRSRRAESPVVSRSKTTSSASSISVSPCGSSASPTRAPSHSSRASPSTTSARRERASSAGARSSANRTRAASSAETAPRRACTSSTSRSAASNASCMGRG